jgi:hypothetical protein
MSLSFVRNAVVIHTENIQISRIRAISSVAYGYSEDYFMTAFLENRLDSVTAT